MSKSIKIPEIGADPLVVRIDGQEPQEFQAGETYTVSNEVAAVIENIIASFPQESGKNAPLVPSPSVADVGKVVSVGSDGQYKLGDDAGSDLPVPTIADAGKAIVVGDDGEYELGEVSSDPGYEVTTTTEVLLPPTEVTWNETTDAWLSISNVSNGFNAGDTIRFTIDGQSYEYVAESKDLGGQTIYFAGEFNPEESVLGPCVLSLENDETGPFLQFISPTEPSNETISAEKVIETVIVTDNFALARGYNVKTGTVYVEETDPVALSGNRYTLNYDSIPPIGSTVLVDINGVEEKFVVYEADMGRSAISSDNKFTINFNDYPNVGEATYYKYADGVEPTYVKVSNYDVFVTDDFKGAVAASSSASGGAFSVHVIEGEFDKTYEEIVAAINSSYMVQIIEGSATGGAGDMMYISYATQVYETGGVYVVQTTSSGYYSTDSVDGYPHVSDS